MLKKRSFWVGFLAGGIVIFFYAWFSIWATYIALERGHLEHELELRQIKRILFLSEDIVQERDAIIEWNRENMKPKPIEVVAGEEQ